MMKINKIVNLIPIATGGGLQNANSFIESFYHSGYDKDGIVFMVRSGSDLEKLCQSLNLLHLSIGNNFLDRFKFENFSKSLFPEKSICFTLFGPPPICSFGRSINIVGCAYSNLFYPDIPFWSYLPWKNKIIKEGIDWARRYFTKRADFWIFETEALRKRAIDLCNFPEERVSVVRMAPSNLVSEGKVNPAFCEKLNKVLPNSFKILYLSGAHPNKRLHLLPEIAEQLVDIGCDNFTFITTVDESSSYSKKVFSEFEKKKLKKHLYNIGPVPCSDVASVIHLCNAMCNLSLLESFSNNFIEAWKMSKPIVVTDADWSRDSCGEAALYVDPCDAKQAALTVSQLIRQVELQNHFISKGKIQLSSYNTPESKLNEYFETFKKATELGPLSESRRKKIQWP